MMKNTISILLILLSFTMFSQEEKKPLFQKSNHWGGFGGVNLTINPAGNLAVSGEGAWIFKNFYLGGFGGGSNYGNHVSPSTERSYCLKKSMGGFMIGGFSNRENLLALFGEARFGFGEMLARTTLAPNIFEEYEEEVMTITPMAGITITPVEFAQIRLFVGYEYTTDFDLVGIKSDASNGAIFGLGLYLGYF